MPPPPAALAPLAPPPAFDEDAPLPLTAEQPVLFVPEGEAAIPAEIVSDEDAPMPMMDGFGQAQLPEVGAGRLIVGVAGAALVLDGLISILASTDRRGFAQVVRLGRAGLGAGMLVKALR